MLYKMQDKIPMKGKEMTYFKPYVPHPLTPLGYGQYPGRGILGTRDNLITQLIGRINEAESKLFSTDYTPGDHDDTTVIHVGDDISLDDISIELSPDATTLTVEIKKHDEDNNITRYMKQSYYSDRKFNYEDMNADLLDGDLVIYAPYVEDKELEDDSEEKTAISIKHTPQEEKQDEEEADDKE